MELSRRLWQYQLAPGEMLHILLPSSAPAFALRRLA
jgi:hypothetical protein